VAFVQERESGGPDKTIFTKQTRTQGKGAGKIQKEVKVRMDGKKQIWPDESQEEGFWWGVRHTRRVGGVRRLARLEIEY